ncbi:Capsular polysaccharide synthesis protein [Methylobacterium sp. 174MFSha1.1]|uniref:capsular polysaccharide synthesis protein n=1 Tax=Methylobacterium sp. 174MFSha1.1 TaxID=1502749 RepID=UPI0008E294EE|nr:capsular polysaccharide synthesis protein [Methylobacterium sp. 174MFSha1.1]SFV15124.1 Capsular polysaccharide synthesis protein [Methylobacterium sp. 174MFSha1.1]
MAYPKVIYISWLQGIENAPDLVKFALEQWRTLNSDYDVIFIDQKLCDQVLEDYTPLTRNMTHQALTDILRAVLLRRGGIWVDATVIPRVSLDSWLPGLMNNGFFAFSDPSPDRIIASWFLAASAKNLLMERWLCEMIKYWSTPRQQAFYNGSRIPEHPTWEVDLEGGGQSNDYPYFWMDYIFGLIVEKDKYISEIWDSFQRESANAPQQLQILFESEDQPTSENIISLFSAAPLHKLNWRTTYPLELLAQ